jgi:hypothetical protein
MSPVGQEFASGPTWPMSVQALISDTLTQCGTGAPRHSRDRPGHYAAWRSAGAIQAGLVGISILQFTPSVANTRSTAPPSS